MKYLTWILDKFQEVLSTNPWMIDSKNFTGPDPPEWREWASVAYFKDKLYYLGGKDAESFMQYSKRVDVKNWMKVHKIINSGFNRRKMENRTCSSSLNWLCSNNNMRWNFIRSHYSIFIIVIMDIQLLMVGKIERYIDYQTMNENGLKLEKFQNNEVHSELHR